MSTMCGALPLCCLYAFIVWGLGTVVASPPILWVVWDKDYFTLGCYSVNNTGNFYHRSLPCLMFCPCGKFDFAFHVIWRMWGISCYLMWMTWYLGTFIWAFKFKSLIMSLIQSVFQKLSHQLICWSSLTHIHKQLLKKFVRIKKSLYIQF